MRNPGVAFLSGAVFALAVFAANITGAQPQQSSPSLPGEDMSGHDISGHDMSRMGSDSSMSEGGAHAMHAMETHHMDMGPHMKMTALRDTRPGDEARARKVVEAARRVAEKYKDYRVALNDGFQIFLPRVPQKIYHFTDYRYAFEADFAFNPEHPTSLLYEKQGNHYRLVGVMYTAPRSFTEADLDKRIPLSVAQWHEHVNLCMPPSDRKREAFGRNARFGLQGSIATKEECDANGGTFHRLVFNWMVHVYPLERSEAAIWDVTRGHDRDHVD